jgi:hypothetical protein
MAFTCDYSNSIGRVRLYSAEFEEATALFEDEAILAFISDSNGHVRLAAYFAVTAKITYLGSNPVNKSISGYSEGYNVNHLQQIADRLKDDLEKEGVAIDGQSVAQYGFAEMSRDKHSWLRVEMNKALRGQPY